MVFATKVPWFVVCAALIAPTASPAFFWESPLDTQRKSASSEGLIPSAFTPRRLQQLDDLHVPEIAQTSILNLMQSPHVDQQVLWGLVTSFPWAEQSCPPNTLDAALKSVSDDEYLFGDASETAAALIKLNSALPNNQQKHYVITGAHEIERTFVSQGIARALGRPVYIINCNKRDIDSNFSTGFAGTSAMSGDKKGPGAILKAFCATQVVNPIIVLQNIDSLSKKEIRNLFACVNPEGRRLIHDNFLQIDIPTGEVTFIVTAASLNEVPRALAKRMDSRALTISLSPYCRDQKIESAYRILLPQALQGYTLPEATIQSIKRFVPAIVDLSSSSTVGLSPVKSALSKVVSHCAIATLQNPETPYVLTNQGLEELLPQISSDEFEITPEIFAAIQQQVSNPHINKAAYLAALSAFPWKKPQPLSLDRNDVIRALNAKNTGLIPQIMRLYEILATRSSTPLHHRKAICLVGPEGTGKSMLTTAIAQALSIPSYLIDLKQNPSLNGEASLFGTSEPSVFYTALCATKTRNPLIVLDNIDEIKPGNMPVLLNALDGAHCTQFRDHFMGFSIDLSHAFFITTATSPAEIPTKLLDHLELIYCDGYNREEKLVIARNHLLQQALTGRAVLPAAAEEIQAILPTLVDIVSPNNVGIHGLNRAIQGLVDKQMASVACYGRTLNLTPETVKSYIDPLLTTHQVSDGKNVQARCNEIIKKLNLTPEQFKLIDNHITALKPWKGGDAITLMYMDWVARFPFKPDARQTTTPEKALEQLNSTHAGLGSIKESVIDFLSGVNFSQRATGQSVPKILCFIGGPGVGKSTISESIAKALGRPFYRIPLESIRSLKGGMGEHEMFGDGPGPIGRAMCITGSQSPVVLLDEIDKANQLVMHQLLEVLDPAQNKTFRDSFLGFDIDLSNVVFIASANNASEIADPLYDRLHMVSMEPYSQQERIDIANTMIVPSIAKAMGFDAVTTEALHNLVRPIVEKIKHTEYGVRNLKRFLQVAADKYARMLMEKGSVTPLSVSDVLGDLHAELLQINPAKIPASEPVIGITNGMYASGSDGGGISKIEASVIPFGTGALIKPLLHGKSKQEAQVRILAYVKSLCSHYNIDPEIFSKSDFLFSDQTYDKSDGPSAGVAGAVALISALTKRPVKPGYAMTGAIDAYGNLLPVGGYRAKILGTEQAGIKNILLPECSRHTVEKIRKDFPEINITYIKTLDEAVKILLEEQPMR